MHLLTADILVPMDASRSVLTDAGVAIDGDAITNSFDARAEAKAQAEAVGARLDKKLIGRLAPMLNYGYSEPRQK